MLVLHIQGKFVTRLAIGAEFARLSRAGLVTKAESSLATESETNEKTRKAKEQQHGAGTAQFERWL